uniref:Uncharacterized protein n=1 Tax=Aegilops tauschii subsp. strangulata TaxID=200361 RepID=A0A453JYD2_AEGTS
INWLSLRPSLSLELEKGEENMASWSSSSTQRSSGATMPCSVVKLDDDLLRHEEEAAEEIRRGPWTVEEDLTLVNYIADHGDGRWNSLARAAGAEADGEELPAAVAELPPAGREARQLHRRRAAAHPRPPLPLGQQVVQDSSTPSWEDRQRDQKLLEDKGAKARQAAQL